MKKSVVATTACVSLMRYTAASSAVSMPTIRSRGTMPGAVLAMISCSTPGAILQPQPPPWLNDVRRGGRSGAFTLFRLHACGAGELPEALALARDERDEILER